MLWNMTLQRKRGKSSLAMKSINDGYYHSRGYVPIDIAAVFLAETSKRIASRFPSLWVRPIERNFLDVFEVPFDGSGGGRAGFFPGSTMGNLNTIEAQALLAQRLAAEAWQDADALFGLFGLIRC
ncbi:L-histidine N(alpha)-methyltransferase [Sinorhizobium mexicanum]|uniref:L-histidine N(alpha)-methyltransferase n=1 Tax=Sinorhizobium mexicanum TaxID=375549 RepID=UPI001D9D198E|nr:L-histidine N(alpha)-methyltransferase [Sinorhizobium mexicanum]MBP1888375.1 putative SAM-dependent methyltransferase [Sinorhizobium mexicanum]